MNNKNDGPAFPDSDGQTGITLRDYFAAKAMQTLASYYLYDQQHGAKLAYLWADAMLAEREKVNEGN